MESEVFEKLSPTKLFFRCVIPSMITMSFGALYQIADGLFVGKFIGQDALAAVNLIMPIIMIVFCVADMIASGASVRISILLGEKNREEASKVFTFTLKLIFFVSLVLGILGIVCADSFVRLIAPNASDLAISYGVTYTKVYAIFAPIMLIYHATDNYLRVCGRETVSMWLSVITQVLNIVLDIVLIAYLNQGVWAAAFTSCFAMSVGSIVSLIMFRNQKMDLYFCKGRISRKDLWRILVNGSSQFFSGISMSIMSIVFNLFLLKYCGTLAVAAFSIIMYVDSVVGMLVLGMSDAMQPAISYCYGARLFHKVKAIMYRVIIGAMVLSGISLLFMFYMGQYVAPLFIQDGDVELLQMSIVGMKLFSLSYITGWVDMCFSSFFTALERPIRSMITSFFGTLVFPIGALFIMTMLFGLNGVWLSAVVSCSLSAILTLLLAFSMKI